MSMWYVYAFIVFMAIVVFFMSPPEFVAARITSLIETHPTLKIQNITKVRVNNQVLNKDEKENFVRIFNEVNFLLSHGTFRPNLNGKMSTQVIIRMDRGKSQEFIMYPMDKYVEICRYKKKGRLPVVYRVESKDLLAMIAEHNAANRAAQG